MGQRKITFPYVGMIKGSRVRWNAERTAARERHEQISLAHDEALLEDSQRNEARLMAEGAAIREANQMEQIAAWLDRHDVAPNSVVDILAARGADHDEAIALNELITKVISC